MNSPLPEPKPNPFVAAWRGLRTAVRTERNLRIHLGVLGIVLLVGSLLPLSRTDWGLLFLASVIVLVTELLNTAIEKTLDRVAPEWHPQTRAAKDIAAAAVLIAACTSVLIGLIVLGPPLWELGLTLLTGTDGSP